MPPTSPHHPAPPRIATSPHALAPPRIPPSPHPRCHPARPPHPEHARNPHPKAEKAGEFPHRQCARAAPAAPPPPTILQRGQPAGPVLFITAPTSQSPTDKPAATPANRPPLQPTGSCSPSVAKPRNPSANNASPAPRRRFKPGSAKSVLHRLLDPLLSRENRARVSSGLQEKKI